jgi:hypothetical protein
MAKLPALFWGMEPVILEYQGLDGDDAVLLGDVDGRPFYAVLTEEALEDDSEPPVRNPSPQQFAAIVNANLALISSFVDRRIDAAMLTRGPGGEIPRLTIRSGELRLAGSLLRTDSLTRPAASWADPVTGRFD